MFQLRIHLVLAASLATTTALDAQPLERDHLPARMMLRLRGDAGANAAVLSPDQKVLAAAIETKLAAWEVATGKELWSTKLCAPVGPRCLAFTPDSKTLAVGGDFNVLKLFDARTGKETVALKPSLTRTDWWAVAISPDGKHLAAASIQGILGFWDVKTGKLVHEPTYPATSIIVTIDFASDSKKLAVSTRGSGLINFWDPDLGKNIGSIKVDGNALEKAKLAPDGRSIGYLRPNTDSSINLWDFASAREFRKVGGNRDGRLMESFSFSPDGRTMVVAQINDSNVYLFETATGLERARFQGHAGNVYSHAFAADSRSVLTCAADKTVIQWDVTGAWANGKYQSAKLSPDELTRLWAALGHAQPDAAYRAVWTLALDPERSVPFLRDRLLPGGPVNVPADLLKRIAELDDDDFSVREKAMMDLKRLGAAVEKALRASGGKLSPEGRARLKALLPAIDRQPAGATRLHLTRVLEALELAATPAAREIMEELARGHADDWVREEAAAAAKRWR